MVLYKHKGFLTSYKTLQTRQEVSTARATDLIFYEKR